MATFTAISNKTQNRTAMRKVLDYVMQDYKTVDNGVKLVSGQNCIPNSAYSEFMATKNQYGKANGVFFKQYVQSFKPNTATPEIIHQIGIETAKYFNGFEVVVATHIDRDHWHNHFVVNSVNCETGLKIQINEKGLKELRNYSDSICQKFEIETEMSIHAIDKHLQIENLAIDYKDRPTGSESKLNTYFDGFRILKTILNLYHVYRPLAFFGAISCFLSIIGCILMVPVLKTYFLTGLVPRFPTLIVSGYLLLPLCSFFVSVSHYKQS